MSVLQGGLTSAGALLGGEAVTNVWESALAPGHSVPMPRHCLSLQHLLQPGRRVLGP